jgi:cytochrome c oxidase accessory protein FixG
VSESGQQNQKQADNIYQQTADWQLNTGDIKIVAKRLLGRFRSLKWLAMLTWLPFFLGPYIRWNGQQAILFDIPNRQYHFFDLTVYPQDLWMLALTLVFFAILLAAVTSVAGRIFCGYFCFQTVWADIFTLIEGKCEGQTPSQASKFNSTPWTLNKLLRKTVKHSLWLLIALLTGLSFTAWFTDAFQLWHDYLTLEAALPAWIALAVFTTGTYVLAGFMREQVCLWLCPYARIQSVMVDQDTILPHYDQAQGEPRAKLRKSAIKEDKGSCIDCNLCVAVCPTGIDIRQGQQLGCITCGLCIDACDDVMTKTNQPTGLIRYASHKEIHHDAKPVQLYKRPRVMVYITIMLLALTGVVSGVTGLSPAEFNVLHERQPLFVRLSDGTIQNKYTLKLLNKTQQNMFVTIDISGLAGATLHQAKMTEIEPGKVLPLTVFVRLPEARLESEITSITFIANMNGEIDNNLTYQSMFLAPKL